MVAWQLPNWWEAAVVHHAVVALGAVSNPLMPILRDREFEFMLRQAGPSVLVVPEVFRGFDFATMGQRLASSVDTLEHLVIVRGTDAQSAVAFERLIESAPGSPATPSADDPALLLYTSGTEADPKGAVHSHNTLGYEIRSIQELYGLTGDDVVFMPSPIGHITGVLYGLHLPILLGSAVIFQDVWRPGEALELIERERCTFQVGATPFLHALAHHPDLPRHDVRSLRVFACGGADVSPELVRTATQHLDCTVVRVYGSTEMPTVTGCNAADPLEWRAGSDGRVIGAAELRVERRQRDLRARAELVLGYLDADISASAFDADGWFATGDLGRLHDGQYLEISGRAKDVILRGGENISAKEVEDLLLEHEDVCEVAVVAMPDPIMVERACAFVVPEPGASPTLDDLAQFLRDRRIAHQKLPERLELVSELPRTPSGKIRKFELRAEIRERLAAEAV